MPASAASAADSAAQISRSSPPPRAFRRGEHAVDRPDPPVECELAERGVPTSRSRGSCSDAARIERAIGRSKPEPSFLSPAGARLTVIRCPATETRPADAAANPVLRLLARAVGEADDREARQAALDVSLDLDATGVETDERMGDRAREHTTEGSREDHADSCQSCANSRRVRLRRCLSG